MRRKPVAHQQQRPAQVAMHVTQESNHIRRMGILVQEIVVQAEATSPRGAAERRHCGNPIVPVPGMLYWRMAALGPDAPSQRLQQIAAFIEKYQASFSLGALFLVVANARSASARSPLPDVRVLVARVSAGSNPAGAITCRRSRDGSRLRTTAKPDPEPRGRSNLPAHSSSVACQALVPPAIAVVDVAPASDRDRDAVWPSASSRPRAARLSSSGLPTTRLPPQTQPLPPMISLAQKAGLQHIGELPALRDFQKVSCTIIRSNPVWFH